MSAIIAPIPDDPVEGSREPRLQSLLTRRSTILAGIVVAHAGLVYALAWSLAREQPIPNMTAVEVEFIKEPKVEEPPPPPIPDPRPAPLNAIWVPEPEVQVNVPRDDLPLTVTNIPPPSDPVARVPQPQKISYRVGPSFIHAVNMSKYYPVPSRRQAEQGVVTLKVCVNADGRYEGTPSVIESSGYPRLDDAGVTMVLDNKMRPGTVDGVPVRSCESLAVEFKLPT